MRSTLVLLFLATSLPGSFLQSSAEKDDPNTLVPPPWKHTLGLHRVVQTHLNVYSGYRKKFANPQGVTAVKLDHLDKEGRGDDDELTVYGVNSGTGEVFYNKSMTSLGFYGRETPQEELFGQAVGISADAMGNVFVADRGKSRITSLRHEPDNTLSYLASFDLSETGYPLDSPTDVSVEGAQVYITDTGNNRVVRTDFDGKRARQLAALPQVSEPFGIDVIASPDWNFFGSQFIVVTDSANQRLSKLALDGSALGVVRFREIADGPGGFYFVATDYYSNIYATDRIAGCIYKFDRHLRYLTRFGCRGGGQELDEPRGIAIYRRFGQVFVAERSGASYFWVGTDVQNLRTQVIAGADDYDLHVQFLLTEQSAVDVYLERGGGKAVKTFTENQFVQAGRVDLQYRVSAEEARCPVANCSHRVRVRARPTYSSSSFHSVERTTPLRGL